MTENKKRGRGRPRKEKSPEFKKAAESVEFIEPAVIDEKIANYVAPDIIILKGRKGNAILGVRKDIIPDKPFPKDWDGMGKVEKLAWLTANPR